ncbi:hypothetical protein D3C79_751910 [compost metagenome]
MIRVGSHEAFGGHHHGGQGSLHVGGATAVQHAVQDGRLERRGVPFVQRPCRHHVGVSGEAEQRPFGATTGPEVGGVLEHHGLDDEAQTLEARRHQGLAPLVQGGN